MWNIITQYISIVGAVKEEERMHLHLETGCPLTPGNVGTVPGARRTQSHAVFAKRVTVNAL